MKEFDIEYTASLPKIATIQADSENEAVEVLRDRLPVGEKLEVISIKELKNYTVEYECTAYYRVKVSATSEEEAKEIIQEKLETGPDDEDGIAFSEPIITKVKEEN